MLWGRSRKRAKLLAGAERGETFSWSRSLSSVKVSAQASASRSGEAGVPYFDFPYTVRTLYEKIIHFLVDKFIKMYIILLLKKVMFTATVVGAGADSGAAVET